MSNKRNLLFFSFILVSLASCVPSRQYEELKARKASCEEENARLKKESQDVTTASNELNAKVEDLKKRKDALEVDTALMGKTIRTINKNYDQMNATYNMLLEKNAKLIAGNADENKKLVDDLQFTQDILQKKEDALKLLERDLNKKKENLDELNKELMIAKEQVQKREEKIREMQRVLNSKDSAVAALKSKVSDALLGFENNGLTIQQKNGKVYVSMEERLLFASGSITVEAKGQEALKKLAKVLEQNTDINVLIEGHTDDVPMNGSGQIKDNWDLSVMRATSIVKIITKNSNVNPTRLTAAGRGEFMPVDDRKSADARKKNRRTEIILTPKLDELLKILETN
jgi:chemotaxis protein MotB